MEDEKPTIADQREFTTGNGHPEISQQSSSITGDESRPMDSQKGNDADHGNRFQSKLLLLFFLRAINKGYDFYLGTELPDQGAKFDDLIFKYHKQRNEGSDTSSWSYQYLQAKHKKYETESTKIKENQLLADAGDFSVPKYFRSFLEMSRRGDDIENCIVCTNADVDQNLVAAVQGDVTPEMLVFDEFVKESQLAQVLLNSFQVATGKCRSYQTFLQSEIVAWQLFDNYMAATWQKLTWQLFGNQYGNISHIYDILVQNFKIIKTKIHSDENYTFTKYIVVDFQKIFTFDFELYN